MTARPAYVLVTVLWVLAITGVVVSAAARRGHIALRESQYRVLYQRAVWRARGCIAGARARLEAEMRAGPMREQERAWREVPAIVARQQDEGQDSCDVGARPEVARLNVNTVQEVELRRFLSALWPSADVTTMAESLLDWRDDDAVPRSSGAETEWYDAHDRPRPRNAPLHSELELLEVRGWERAQDLLPRLSTEGEDAIDATAPPPRDPSIWQVRAVVSRGGLAHPIAVVHSIAIVASGTRVIREVVE
jgi:type II secretory pathway component PulK